jgi:adenylate cyclase
VGLKDIRSTPLDTFVPGVEVHLNIVDQILEGKFLSRSIEAEGIEAVAIITVGLFIIIFSPFLGAAMQAAVVFVTLITGIYAGLQAFKNYGLLLDVTYPAFSVLALFMLSTVLTYLRSEREKRQVRQAFGLYISPDFMNELTRSPDKLKLGGETRELSVMFSDIRRFTTISEGLGPQELIQMMNDFLTPMSDLVMQNRGTIDKYIGDAMMAFWNAPLDDTHHARNACLTALKMQDCLTPINQKIVESLGASHPLLEVGIGINTGPCAVGNMGSRQRFAYSALGDAVNLASRLEGQTKYYGVPIIIGEETQRIAEEFAVFELDYIKVQGKEKPVHIYGLYADESVNSDPDFKVMLQKHKTMLDFYREGSFTKARECLSASHPDYLQKTYSIYMARIDHYIKNPPVNWQGVFEAESK